MKSFVTEKSDTIVKFNHIFLTLEKSETSWSLNSLLSEITENATYVCLDDSVITRNIFQITSFSTNITISTILIMKEDYIKGIYFTFKV